MIKERAMLERPKDAELEEKLEQERLRLAGLQIKVKEKGIPVIVLLEGWGSAGKGSVLKKLIQNLDPRFFKVEVMNEAGKDEKRRPFLYRHFIRIPEKGKFAFFDSGWLDEIVRSRTIQDGTKEEYNRKLNSVVKFERQLCDNGYCLLKFFFNIDKKEQKKRLDELLKEKNTKWRVSEFDIWQNEHYSKCEDYFEECMGKTDAPYAPWYVIDAKDKKWAELQTLEIINQGIETALDNERASVPILQNVFPLKKMPKLEKIDLDKTFPEEEYKEELDRLQKRLGELHNELYIRKIPVIIAYEGWDAAGKGGNIKRVTQGLDPRGYEVCPIASPEPHEKARHYLWRFFTRLPKTGHVTIFDRTWYGRVMVERIEGFCSENEWKRAYNEINEFEAELLDWGAVLVKFWVQIDKDVQLERFNERENTPEKRWKITDEDWRNREKWDMYEQAVNEMIEKTSTGGAPWHILESNDKHYARIKALKILIKEIEARLETYR